MSSEFLINFYGCRGSIPVSGPSYQRYGGATPCVGIRAGGRDIVLDAGSGLIDLGKELMGRYQTTLRPIQTYLFITHAHLDHLMGLPYFSPVFLPDTSLWVAGPKNMRFASFQETVDAFMAPPFFPVPRYEMAAEFLISDIGEADVVYFVRDQPDPIQLKAHHPRHQNKVPDPKDVEVRVECMRGYNHPKSGVNIYKVIADGKTVVYATDTEGFVQGDRRLIEFSRGADLLIHDAMYSQEVYTAAVAPTQGYGHSTVEIATSLAKAAGVKRLVLFHHAPSSSDEDLDQLAARGQKLFAETYMAHDGLQIAI